MISGTNIYWTFAFPLGILRALKDEVGGFRFGSPSTGGDGLILRCSHTGVGRLISTTVGTFTRRLFSPSLDTLRQADFCRDRRGLISALYIQASGQVSTCPSLFSEPLNFIISFALLPPAFFYQPSALLT
jgi:hypothetical protein